MPIQHNDDLDFKQTAMPPVMASPRRYSQ